MINALLASLGTKAAVAAIAGTVAAGGLGVAAVALPDQDGESIPVETVEDDDVSASVDGTDVEGEEVEGKDVEAVEGEEVELLEEENDAEADEAKDNFGARVSEDAKDGGVDGRQIAAEASEGRSEAGREKAAEASEGRSEAGAENRTAGDDARTEHQPVDPATEAPEQADAGEAQAEERKGGGQANRPADAGDDADDDEDAEELEETPES